MPDITNFKSVSVSKKTHDELQDMANNPPSRGTCQRGTAVTTAGEDEQTLDITKSKDCGCNECGYCRNFFLIL